MLAGGEGGGERAWRWGFVCEYFGLWCLQVRIRDALWAVHYLHGVFFVKGVGAGMRQLN